jgi:hypothetical protein
MRDHVDHGLVDRAPQPSGHGRRTLYSPKKVPELETNLFSYTWNSPDFRKISLHDGFGCREF